MIVLKLINILGCCTDDYLPNGIIIDVRSTGEYESGHVQDCINIPHNIIGQKIGEYAKDRNTPINLYCEGGSRASTAKSTLLNLGYNHVANLGGYSDAVKKINDYNNKSQ